MKGDSLTGDAAVPWYQKAVATLQRGAALDQAECDLIRRENRDQLGLNVAVWGWMPLYLELGRTYLRLHDPQHALQPLAYGRAHSTDVEFAIELANAWRAQGNWERAAIVLIEPLEEGLMSPRLTAELAKLYRESAPGSCALAESGGNLSVNLACPLVRTHLCMAAQDLAVQYRAAGQLPKAQAMAQLAARNFGCPLQ